MNEESEAVFLCVKLKSDKEMKKLVLMLCALFSMMGARVSADGLTATLQQGDVMTPFYGVDAFKEAYNAAQDGAVITLSSGKFNDIGTVDKQITIVGAYAFDRESPETTFLEGFRINADNVKIEGIYFTTNVVLGEISNCHIKRCWINDYLSSSNTHTNTLVDQCVVMCEKAIAHGINYCIKNSTILAFYSSGSPTNLAYITDCVIYILYSRNNSVQQCPNAIYKNNILYVNENTATIDSDELGTTSEFYDNLFVNCRLDYRGQPIKLKFPTGCQHSGNTSKAYEEMQKILTWNTYPAKPNRSGYAPLTGTGFSEWPAIPRVTSSTIDAHTDVEGKINVNITVKAEP